MVSTVTARPSHYEVLGLTPAATADEIARAFAREMSRPRAFGAIAEVSIAYATLRDPARRRAYDESLGLTRAPTRAPLLSSAGVGGAAFLARPALVAEPAPAATAPPRPERPDIAEALRQLSRPEPLHDAVQPVPPEPAPPPAAERVHLAIADGDTAPAGAIPWKPVALAAGGVALAVALLGALGRMGQRRRGAGGQGRGQGRAAAADHLHRRRPGGRARAGQCPAARTEANRARRAQARAGPAGAAPGPG